MFSRVWQKNLCFQGILHFVLRRHWGAFSLFTGILQTIKIVVSSEWDTYWNSAANSILRDATLGRMRWQVPQEQDYFTDICTGLAGLKLPVVASSGQ